jgi:hypothetical protein
MTLGPTTKIDEVLTKYPFIKEFLIAKHEHFAALDNPIMRRTLGRIATISRVAMVGGMELDSLLREMAAEIERRTGDRVGVAGLRPATPEERREVLKGIILDLHAGGSPEVLKGRFRELIADVSPAEIGQMEQSLIADGMPPDEVKRLCDVHVQVFREALEKGVAPGLPAGHPVQTAMRENRAAEGVMDAIDALLSKAPVDWNAVAAKVAELAPIHTHYLRKENQLFPVLERHGIVGPSKVMWALHDDVRAMLKDVRATVAGIPADAASASLRVRALLKMVRDMIYKEEHILFPMTLDTLTDEEWAEVASGEGEIGYAWVAPEGTFAARPREASEAPPVPGTLNLDTGRLAPDVVNLILTHLPVDISFVDENDEVAYYSATEDRIFPRSPGVIGRKVQNCHPPSSVDVVNEILDSFRSGRRDVAEFWIQMKGRFLHIRYFAVRDSGGAYRGCLEVSQDVTAIRALEGEKRLLSWE